MEPSPGSHEVGGAGAIDSRAGDRLSGQSGEAAPASGHEHVELLEQFLHDRDIDCPGCGYNLRGSRASACPECGKPLELSLAVPRRMAGIGAFALLAFAWVMLAAGMNETREFKSIYDQAMLAATPRFTFSWSSSMTTSVTVNGKTTTTTTVNPNGTNGVIINGMTGGGRGAQAPQIVMTPQGVVQIPAPTGVSGPMWSAVPGSMWWALGWWGGLVLASLIGLLALGVLLLRKRPPSRAATRWMVTYACLVFVLYAGYHGQMFVREVMTW